MFCEDKESWYSDGFCLTKITVESTAINSPYLFLNKNTLVSLSTYLEEAVMILN